MSKKAPKEWPMSDLVERLRRAREIMIAGEENVTLELPLGEAADEIERLRAELAKVSERRDHWIEQIKRLAYKVEDAAFDKAYSATDDNEWAAAAIRLNKARAALHAALDALVKEE